MECETSKTGRKLTGDATNGLALDVEPNTPVYAPPLAAYGAPYVRRIVLRTYISMLCTYIPSVTLQSQTGPCFAALPRSPRPPTANRRHSRSLAVNWPPPSQHGLRVGGVSGLTEVLGGPRTAGPPAQTSSSLR